MHTAINLVLGVLAFRAFSFPKAYLYAILALAAVGGAIELLQFYSPNREPAFSDLAANLLGIGIAAVLSAVLHSREVG